MTSPFAAAPFHKVLKEELEAIDRRRLEIDSTYSPNQAPQPFPDDSFTIVERIRRRALERDLVGLAFSGGGIRSATFNLGILQGLASLGRLKRVDYLSGVSGGGYIASWLSAWLCRESTRPPAGVTPGSTSIVNVEKQLNPRRVSQADAERAFVDPTATRPPTPFRRVIDDEPEPILHLRAHSRYLAPRAGVFSPDSWALIVLYLRNVLINLLLIVPFVMLSVLGGRLFLALMRCAYNRDPGLAWLSPVMATTFGATMFFAFLFFHRERGRLYESTEKGGMSSRKILLWVILPMMGASIAGTWVLAADPLVYFRMVGGDQYPREKLLTWPGGMIWLTWLFGTMFLFFSIICQALWLGFGDRESFENALSRLRRPRLLVWPVMNLLAPAWMGATGGAILWLLLKWVIVPLQGISTAKSTAGLITIGPPLLMLTFVVARYSLIAILGRLLTEHDREFQARVAAMMMIAEAVWALYFGITIYLPWGLRWAASEYWSEIKWGAVGTWLLNTICSGIKGSPLGASATSRFTRLMLHLGPVVFLIGLLAMAAELAALLPLCDCDSTSDFIGRVSEPEWTGVLLWAGVFALIAFFGLLVVDVNLFSLHSIYANRLVRCYLGATRTNAEWQARYRVNQDPPWRAGRGGAPTNVGTDLRVPHPFTGFDEDDDLPLHELRKAPSAPFLLLNASLTNVGNSPLERQDRKAESFFFSSQYCGSETTGFARTPNDDANGKNLTLGRAMAISGAAVDPNMSLYQSAPLTAFLTVLNIRLGFWLESPRTGPDWTANSPGTGRLLLDELLGNTDAERGQIRLTDGGHFENLGVYELVRRRCRYIVAVDAAEDPLDASENLANLVRLCRTDFGIRIDIDTSPIHKNEQGLSQSHCAVGIIHYEDVDAAAVPGTFVFVRSSLTGDEPADIKNYAAANPKFPHHPTIDQFFDEAQFESYRALGYHVARVVFGDIQLQPSDYARNYQQENRRFFSKLRNRWLTPPPRIDERYAESANNCMVLLQKLGSDEMLHSFNHRLYPELVDMGLMDANDPRRVAEFRTIDQMLQVMELAWLGIQLDQYHAHPLNRGWMNTFRRWTATDTFQRFWPVLCGTYSKDFVEFCERTLNVQSVSTHLVQIDDNTAAWRPIRTALNREFCAEWPIEMLAPLADSLGGRSAVPLRRRTIISRFRPLLPPPVPANPDELLNELIDRAGTNCWIVAAEPRPTERDDATPWQAHDYPCGVMLLRPIVHVKDLASFHSSSDGFRDEYELLVWIRGAYRTMGIGRRHLVRVLNHASREIPGARLLVRYPDIGDSPGARLQRSMWLSFFHDFNFRRRRIVRPSPRGFTILEYQVPRIPR